MRALMRALGWRGHDQANDAGPPGTAALLGLAPAAWRVGSLASSDHLGASESAQADFVA